MHLAASPTSSDATFSLRVEEGISAVIQADLAGVLHAACIARFMAGLHDLCLSSWTRFASRASMTYL